LALAREKGWCLIWDEEQYVYLFSRTGATQARTKTPDRIVAACAADDGLAFVVAGIKGELWWLAPDLAVRWQQALTHPALAVALDLFGQYLAVADSQGNLHYFDCQGRPLGHVLCPRPLHHLAFVSSAPQILGCADYGLVIGHDLAGRCLWREGLFAHVGSLAVSGDGEQVVLACFSAGLQRYTAAGTNKGRLPLAEPCRLAAISFDGRYLLVAGLSNRTLLLDPTGRTLCDHAFDKAVVSFALGALGESAVVALVDGRVVGLEFLEGPLP
jgi:hypothetical protein